MYSQSEQARLCWSPVAGDLCGVSLCCQIVQKGGQCCHLDGCGRCPESASVPPSLNENHSPGGRCCYCRSNRCGISFWIPNSLRLKGSWLGNGKAWSMRSCVRKSPPSMTCWVRIVPLVSLGVRDSVGCIAQGFSCLLGMGVRTAKFTTSQMNVFSSKEAEGLLRARLLQRISFAVFAAPQDHYLPHLTAIQVRACDGSCCDFFATMELQSCESIYICTSECVAQ